jgi:hypothetical protein
MGGPAPDGTPAFRSGAGRSGTTLLYKLLCMHRQVAFISNYHERLPRVPSRLVALLCADRLGLGLSAWFRPAGNAYFVSRPWRKRLLPTPVEGEPVYRSCGIPLFPAPGYLPDAATAERLRRRFDAIRRGMSASVMLSKRTANNRRIAALDAVFPGAVFIHMIRDGREVAASLARVEWWARHRLWWDGRTAGQMEASGTPRLAVAARNWVREMAEIERGLQTVPARRVMAVRYEDVLAAPHEQLARILAFLGLAMPAGLAEAVSILRLHQGAVPAPACWLPAQADLVMAEMGPMLDRLGYI